MKYKVSLVLVDMSRKDVGEETLVADAKRDITEVLIEYAFFDAVENLVVELLEEGNSEI